MKVAVLGASDKPERFANQAIRLLRDFHHEVFPINPSLNEIEDLPVFKSLKELPPDIHTLTIYVGPEKIQPLIKDIVSSTFQRVILNPGTESNELIAALKLHSIPYLKACTLVLLRNHEF